MELMCPKLISTIGCAPVDVRASRALKMGKILVECFL